MKNISIKWTSMVLVIMLVAFTMACNNTQEQAGEEVENPEMGERMDNMEGMDMSPENNATAVNLAGEPAFLVDYIEIKNALVNDNFKQVQQAAAEMQSSLENSQLDADQQAELKRSVSQLVEANDIKSQRKAFAQLSQQLYEVVQNTELTDNTLYWQHCPMAMGGQGANWLSYEEQVRNPFMGQRMPGCGSVAEKIQ